MYKSFILGWFAAHIKPIIAFIAVCQGLIAVSMLLKNSFFLAGGTGAIVFLIAILPPGVGAGFPCTAIMAIAIFILMKKHSNRYVWEQHEPVTA